MCLRFVFPALGILQHLRDCDRQVQQADGIHIEINLSNSTLPMVRKEFKELRNFCVSAASQASQLLKIYRMIKTGGWVQPRDKFRLLSSGSIHIFVKRVRASPRYYAVSGFFRNCAPALSIIKIVAVGRALPELFHHPQWSLSMTTTGH